MRRTTLAAFVAFLSFTCTIFRTRAAVTVYSDRDTFTAAIGSHVTFTFDTVDGFPAVPGPIYAFGPALATSGGLSAGPAFERAYPPGTSNQTISGNYTEGPASRTPGQLFLAFDPTQYAVGFDLFPGGIPCSIAVTLLGTQGPYEAAFFTDVETISPSGTTTPVFFGITSTDPVTWLAVRNVGDSKSQVYKGVDNLSVVPEPRPLATLPVVAALAVALLRRPQRGSRLDHFRGFDGNKTRGRSVLIPDTGASR